MEPEPDLHSGSSQNATAPAPQHWFKAYLVFFTFLSEPEPARKKPEPVIKGPAPQHWWWSRGYCTFILPISVSVLYLFYFYYSYGKISRVARSWTPCDADRGQDGFQRSAGLLGLFRSRLRQYNRERVKQFLFHHHVPSWTWAWIRTTGQGLAILKRGGARWLVYSNPTPGAGSAGSVLFLWVRIHIKDWAVSGSVSNDSDTIRQISWLIAWNLRTVG